MNISATLFKLRNKNNKILYYFWSTLRLYFPIWYKRKIVKRQIKQCSTKEREHINERIAYYNKLSKLAPQPSKDLVYAQQKSRKTHRKVYFLDTMRYYRIFPKGSCLSLLDGDVTTIPNTPTIVKSRPIVNNNQNAVILKLNAIRHFNFINDPLQFSDKKDSAIFRGNNLVPQKRCRRLLLEKFHKHPHIDVGLAELSPQMPQEWLVTKTPMLEQLKYKFILCPEGNDVATNLKWVMSSNSIAIMNKPKYETWFMEGKLQAGIHYIEVKEDYSNLEEQIDHYIKHPEEAFNILENAHQYIAQFQNKKLENIINYGVINNYLFYTSQKKWDLPLS